MVQSFQIRNQCIYIWIVTSKKWVCKATTRLYSSPKIQSQSFQNLCLDSLAEKSHFHNLDFGFKTFYIISLYNYIYNYSGNNVWVTVEYSEIGVHVRSNPWYLICLRHFIRLRAVNNWIFTIQYRCHGRVKSNNTVKEHWCHLKSYTRTTNIYFSYEMVSQFVLCPGLNTQPCFLSL